MSGGDPVITRKGQVTIPIEIRRSPGLKRGDRVTFVHENGSARLLKAPSLVEQSAGMLSKYALDHVPADEEMNEAIELAFVEERDSGGSVLTLTDFSPAGCREKLAADRIRTRIPFSVRGGAPAGHDHSK